MDSDIVVQIYLHKDIYDAIIRKGEDPAKVVNETMRKLYIHAGIIGEEEKEKHRGG
ncbi:hypothetical protein ES703_99187 [subsurface metagenome]